jgi:hypothetical protein
VHPQKIQSANLPMQKQPGVHEYSINAEITNENQQAYAVQQKHPLRYNSQIRIILKKKN